MIYQGIPVLGISAWSGTGKTTLLTQAIPLLCDAGLHLGIIKHTHHSFDIDIPGKDSYRLRKAGAEQVIAASRHRIAHIREIGRDQAEPSLDDALATLHTDTLDLILVEGYKHSPIPKIEVFRASLKKPLLCIQDPQIFAIATDVLDFSARDIDVLDINNVSAFADYVIRWAQNARAAHAA
ncbi:MAG TPA: molybdopterin-guanine dinucleotide biosynthesis protein B, partial [Gammaproteobacteria bacterium]|nr:molybdopterin-guanine dinucleotide biosynthesis protein B [Gammaproteobacteria bacterium]